MLLKDISSEEDCIRKVRRKKLLSPVAMAWAGGEAKQKASRGALLSALPAVQNKSEATEHVSPVRHCFGKVVVHCKSGLGRSMSLLAALAVAFCPGTRIAWCVFWVATTQNPLLTLIGA